MNTGEMCPIQLVKRPQRRNFSMRGPTCQSFFRGPTRFFFCLERDATDEKATQTPISIGKVNLGLLTGRRTVPSGNKGHAALTVPSALQAKSEGANGSMT
jgi:hypothetical protein